MPRTNEILHRGTPEFRGHELTILVAQASKFQRLHKMRSFRTGWMSRYIFDNGKSIAVNTERADACQIVACDTPTLTQGGLRVLPTKILNLEPNQINDTDYLADLKITESEMPVDEKRKPIPVEMWREIGFESPYGSSPFDRDVYMEMHNLIEDAIESLSIRPSIVVSPLPN
jgi:hypothetical protein